MNTITNSAKVLSLAFAALVLLALPFAFAKADGFDFVDVYPDMGGMVDVYPDYGGGFTDIYPNSYTDVYPNSYTDVYPNSYSDSYGGYSGGSSFGGYGGSYYSTGFGGGGFYMPTASSMPGISNSNTNVNTNTNTCTGNSCNTVYDDHSVFNAPTTIVTTAAPAQPVYQPIYQPNYYPQQPVCNTCGCPGYQACYRPTIQQQPYVTLAAVPYTGLELGTMGTIAYWGFLVLWCLIAAYLIAVKKVQNNIAAWFTGSRKVTTSTTAHVASAHVAPKVTIVETRQFAGIDPFIASQIAR